MDDKGDRDMKFGPPEIDPDEITLSREIGSGTFGRVFKGVCRSKDVSIKVLHQQKFDIKTLAAFRKEVDVVSKIFHPNITLFMGACTIPGKCMIVTELMPKGDLEKLLRDPAVNLPLTQRMQMARDAALGMNWLHESNPVFLHRDLKTSNLLVDENMRVKICDFGLSQIKQKDAMIRDTQSAKGTPLWMAPEVMTFKEFNEKADVYSFGIVLWEILTRKEPFVHHRKFDKFKHAVCVEHERPIIPDTCPERLRDLIEQCWNPETENRPTFKEIVSELDETILEIAIQDESGRDIWRQGGLPLDFAPWDTFIKAFMTKLNIAKGTLSKQAIDCFKALLAEKDSRSGDADGNEIVNIENFGKILCWLGPCTQDMISGIEDLLSKRWFHGFVDTSDAQNKLSELQPGTFLVRFSSTHPGQYTISQVSADGLYITHQRVEHQDDGFTFNGKSYKTLQDVITQNAEELGLKLSCPGSRYQSLFQQNIPNNPYITM